MRTRGRAARRRAARGSWRRRRTRTQLGGRACAARNDSAITESGGSLRKVITYAFGPGDLARVRFATSPLFELAASWQVLRDPARHSIHAPWIAVARERIAGLDLAMLDAVIPEGPYLPDFVTLPPERARADLATELRRVRATAPEQVARELGWAYPGRRLPPAARILVDDPRAGLRRLVSVMESYWERAVAPWWERLRATLAAAIANPAPRLPGGGPGAALAARHP